MPSKFGLYFYPFASLQFSPSPATHTPVTLLMSAISSVSPSLSPTLNSNSLSKPSPTSVPLAPSQNGKPPLSIPNCFSPFSAPWPPSGPNSYGSSHGSPPLAPPTSSPPFSSSSHPTTHLTSPYKSRSTRPPAKVARLVPSAGAFLPHCPIYLSVSSNHTCIPAVTCFPCFPNALPPKRLSVSSDPTFPHTPQCTCIHAATACPIFSFHISHYPNPLSPWVTAILAPPFAMVATPPPMHTITSPPSLPSAYANSHDQCSLPTSSTILFSSRRFFFFPFIVPPFSLLTSSSPSSPSCC